MAAVNVLSVSLYGPQTTKFFSPFSFQITIECLQQLADDLEWRLVYVGSAESDEYDQVLDSILVGPVSVGTSKFILEAPGPDPARIPLGDALGVTAVLLMGLYQNKEFIRIGYFVNNELDPPGEYHGQDIFNHIRREVLTDKPRVTRFQIDDWNASDNTNSIPMEMSNMGSEDMQTTERVYGFPVESAGIDFIEVLTDADLCKQIFRQLDLHQLGSCRRVCRSWRSFIAAGINFGEIDLSDIEWNETHDMNDAHETEMEQSLLQFALQQSSPELTWLDLSHAKPLTDAFLASWLNKCGSHLEHLDLGWCSKLTPECVDQIVKNCEKIESLRITFIDGGKSIFSDVQLVDKILQKYPNLSELQLDGMIDIRLEKMAEIFKDREISVGFPCGNISENGIGKFLEKCPNVKYLGLELCTDISANFIQHLRSQYPRTNIKSSHFATDFCIWMSESNNVTFVFPEIKDWKEPIPKEKFFEFAKFLPAEVKTDAEGHLSVEGDADRTVEIFQSAGFDEIMDREDGDFIENSAEEGEEGEDVDLEINENEESRRMCPLCKNKTGEDDLECDECERNFHSSCVGLEGVPESDWVCSECKQETRVKKQRT